MHNPPNYLEAGCDSWVLSTVHEMLGDYQYEKEDTVTSSSVFALSVFHDYNLSKQISTVGWIFFSSVEYLLLDL